MYRQINDRYMHNTQIKHRHNCQGKTYRQTGQIKRQTDTTARDNQLNDRQTGTDRHGQSYRDIQTWTDRYKEAD